MLKKILFILLFSFIYSQIVNLTVFQIEGNKSLIINESSGLICLEMFSYSKDFYFSLHCDEKGEKIDKTFFYNLTELSCKHLNNLAIDFDNLKSEFMYSVNKPNLENDYIGFNYEYKISQKEEKQKFILLLFHNFTGQEFSISCLPLSAKQVVYIALFFVFSIIFIINLIIALICIYFRNKKYKSRAPQFQLKKNEAIPLYPVYEGSIIA